jgi:uncharacterized protein YecE (DUF72 family)
VELNASYYRWPSDAALAGWQRRLPGGFVVAVKAPGALTHAERLYGPEAWLARIGQGLDLLGPKCGVLLVQLPPSAAFDHPRLDYFLERVPRGLRTCVEFRNPTWLQDSTFTLLEKHGAAYCVMSGAGLPCVLRATAPFVYARLHGPDHHIFTRAPIARMICAGGRTASGSGRAWAGTCSCTLTPTAVGMRCGMR